VALKSGCDHNSRLDFVYSRMRLWLIFILALASLCGGAVAQDVAIADATVYLSPGATPKTHATILIHAGKIAGIGSKLRIPSGVRVLPCDGCIVFAGFWNTHVHFTGPQWDKSDRVPADQLSRDMQSMLTHSGFTTVVDLSSDPNNTTALRRRVESGEVEGPRIYTAGFGLYPPHGIPFYLDDLPATLLARLPQPATPAAAVEAVQQNQALGSDAVKLFAGSYLTRDNITHMPLDVARAAVSEGHRHSQPVFAHPSDLQGLRIALDSGVDVLAHADTIDVVDDALVKEMVARHMAMIPTLKLFSGSGHIDRIRDFVMRFHIAGGRLLFGTDTGFLTDYDVSEEYRQLELAGLSFRDVLSMLTTNPAAEFNVSSHAGLVKLGGDGDLTILSSDPAVGDLRNFAHVLYAIRAGRVIFEALPQH
jgi:imidazolonepropionase-like amidohydrolase